MVSTERRPRPETLFRRNDLRRALRSAHEAGFTVQRFEIDPRDGHHLHRKSATADDAAGAGWHCSCEGATAEGIAMMDAILMTVVLGTLLVAFTVEIAALLAWLRRHGRLSH